MEIAEIQFHNYLQMVVLPKIADSGELKQNCQGYNYLTSEKCLQVVGIKQRTSSSQANSALHKTATWHKDTIPYNTIFFKLKGTDIIYQCR